MPPAEQKVEGYVTNFLSVREKVYWGIHVGSGMHSGFDAIANITFFFQKTCLRNRRGFIGWISGHVCPECMRKINKFHRIHFCLWPSLKKMYPTARPEIICRAAAKIAICQFSDKFEK